MAENINFIPVTELPEATGEELTVLCIENGEMKQKPGANLGSKECDMRIRYDATDRTYRIIDGTYLQVVSKINNDVPPTIYYIYITSTNKIVSLVTANYFPASNTLQIVADGIIFAVYSDNSIKIAD